MLRMSRTDIRYNKKFAYNKITISGKKMSTHAYSDLKACLT